MLKFILDLPAGEKGKFMYNNACPHPVSTLIQKAIGKKALDYAREKLFDKPGIDCNEWMADRAGVNVGGSGLKLTPFEMSKLGYLYLKNGEWDGAQLVPQKWVEESTAKQALEEDIKTFAQQAKRLYESARRFRRADCIRDRIGKAYISRRKSVQPPSGSGFRRT